MAGIADPLRQLPTMYALFDVTEAMLLENMEKPEDRERYFLRAYAPPSGSTMDSKNLPKGWSAEDEMAAFEQVL